MDVEQTQKASSSPTGEGERKRNRRSFWKRRPVIVVGTGVLAGLLLLGLRYLSESFTHESTDDAFLSADVVSTAPRVGGQVQRVFVEDNQLVKAGQLLVQIDPRDFEIQVAQKEAALASSEANVKLLLASTQLLGTQIATAEATANQSEAEAAADKANADKAEMDLKRAEELIQKHIISPAEYDAAKAAATAAGATWKAGEQKAASDHSKVDQAQAQLEAGRRAWDRAQAQAKQSAVDVQQAELNLAYAHVTAPVDGRVTRKAVEDGDYVQVGQKLMALVPNEIWVTANFKETELRKIRPGQPAKIRIDAVAGQSFAGRVQSIQAGSGAAFSLLPPENAVGNFVKVVQRVPVKIVFEQPPATNHVLGPGMSVEPSVRVRGFEIPMFAVALAASVLAFVAGWIWWWTANREPRAARQ